MKLKTMYNRYKRNKDIIDFLDDAQIFEEDNYTATYYDKDKHELNQEEKDVYLFFSSYREDELILFSISVYDKEEQYHYIFDNVYFAFARYLELLSKFDRIYVIAEKKYILAWDFLFNREPLFEGFEKLC